MLTANKLTWLLTATCDKCGAAKSFDSRDRLAVDSDLRLSGWTPMPRKGLGSERWPWHCPACQPKVDPGKTGFTTALMPSMKGEK